MNINGGRTGPVALHQIAKVPAVLLKGFVLLKANFERFDLFSKKTTLGRSEPVIDPESLLYGPTPSRRVLNKQGAAMIPFEI